MDILKDIAEFLAEDKIHDIETRVNADGVTVCLIRNLSQSGKEVIPIWYSSLEDFSCILKDELRLIDYGIDRDEIELINQIMEYMENNSKEIYELCMSFGAQERFNKIVF